jgi:hypothetical protein
LRRAAAVLPEIGQPPAAVPHEVRVRDLSSAPRAVEALLGATGATDARARAAWFVHGHAWRTAAPAIACLLLCGRAPDAGPANVAVHVDAAGAPRLRLVDPEREVAGAAGLREALTANLAVVAALPALTVVGARARWSLAADAVAGAALHVGRRLAGPADAVELAALLVGGPGPLRVPLAIIDADPPGGGDATRWRGSCCLAHREGLDLCPSCPRRRSRRGHGAGG